MKACVFLFMLILVCEASRRFPAFSLNNWADSLDQGFLFTWTSSRENPNQVVPIRPSGINSLRIGKDSYGSSSVKEESFALIVDDSLYLTNPYLWDGDAFLLPNLGGFQNTFDTYGELPVIGVEVNRTYYLPPGEQFYLIEYEIFNPLPKTMLIKLLDYVITDHPGTGDIKAFLDPSTSALIADMTSASQYALGTGSWTSYQSVHVGDTQGKGSGVWQFEHNQGYLDNQTTFSGIQAGLSSSRRFLLGAQQKISVFFYRSVALDYASLSKQIQRIISVSPQDWKTKTTNAYNNWLAKGTFPSFSAFSADEAERQKTFYMNGLLMLKNAIMPGVGTIVASFHPVYGYKVWARDGAFAAFILDSAGYHAEAEGFLLWMANAELRPNNQGFHTCYDWFSGKALGFVEPQYDNAGTFLTAAYYHYKKTSSNSFLSSMIHRINDIENFYLDFTDANGLAPSDYSIWEESSDPYTGSALPTSYFSFTQGMSFSGLVSASKIETVLGQSQRAKIVQQRAELIRTAVEQQLWISSGQYYGRGIRSDNFQLDTRTDGSSVALIFTGLITSPARAKSHLQQVISNLTVQGSAISRYWGDIFFYKSKFNPGGMEANGPNPPWGVVTMFTAWSEMTLGVSSDSVVNRLKWMVSHGAPGLMPVGEGVDGVTGEFVMSGCPDIYEHGGVFVYTSLLLDGKAELPNPAGW